METSATEIDIIRVKDTSERQLASWSVPRGSSRGGFAEIRGEWWSATSGTLQQNLFKINSDCALSLDFSHAKWVDPLPLLSIVVAIYEFCCRINSSVVIQLGQEPNTNEQRGGFLKFIVQRGFLAELRSLGLRLKVNGGDDYVNVDRDADADGERKNNAGETNESIATLCTRLSSEAFAMTYAESRCLTAKGSFSRDTAARPTCLHRFVTGSPG